VRPNRAPSTSWFLRRDLERYPNGYVSTSEGDEIRVTYFMREDYPQTIFMTRRDARLIAKRINECLDRTAIR
jgi:hypothetical protein